MKNALYQHVTNTLMTSHLMLFSTYFSPFISNLTQ